MSEPWLEGETIQLEVDKELARLLLLSVYSDPDLNYREMGKLIAATGALERFIGIGPDDDMLVALGLDQYETCEGENGPRIQNERELRAAAAPDADAADAGNHPS